MFRVIWSEPDEWWPRFQDFATDLAAHTFAAETTQRIGDGVEVHGPFGRTE